MTSKTIFNFWLQDFVAEVMAGFPTSISIRFYGIRRAWEGWGEGHEFRPCTVAAFERG